MKTEFRRYENLNYVYALPDNYDSSKKYPAILFLHGAGTRGDNIEAVLGNGYFVEGMMYGESVVSFVPQCNADSWFDVHEQLMCFAKFISECPEVDSNRVYLMGSSMGGYGTWALATSCPDIFAAIVPICGGGAAWNAFRLINMDVWAVHGELDDCVHPDESRRMIESITAAGGNRARLTIIPNRGHNAWTYTFENREILAWLLSKSKTSDGVITELDEKYKYKGSDIYG